MHRIKRSIVAGFALAVAAVPSAAQAVPSYAGPNPDQQTAVARAAPYELTSSFHTDLTSGGYFTPVVSAPSGPQTASAFQWGDAGIGAAGAVVLLSVGALGTGLTRRGRTVAG
jgi:hypothetical protein